jgi:hypothetical protein
MRTTLLPARSRRKKLLPASKPRRIQTAQTPRKANYESMPGGLRNMPGGLRKSEDLLALAHT